MVVVGAVVVVEENKEVDMRQDFKMDAAAKVGGFGASVPGSDASIIPHE